MKTMTGLIVALCGLVLCISMISFADNNRAVNEEGEKQMPTVFKKIVDGKFIDVTPEEAEAMRKMMRPPLLTDKASIEIVRKYTKLARARNEAIFVKETDPKKKALRQGMVSALMEMEVELCGLEQ